MKTCIEREALLAFYFSFGNVLLLSCEEGRLFNGYVLRLTLERSPRSATLTTTAAGGVLMQSLGSAPRSTPPITKFRGAPQGCYAVSKGLSKVYWARQEAARRRLGLTHNRRTYHVRFCMFMKCTRGT